MYTAKEPAFENDDYIIRLEGHNLIDPQKAYEIIRTYDQSSADYYETKRKAFASKNTDPNLFMPFVESRPSLRSLIKLKKLDSTIYTVACERENNSNYESLLHDIRQHLKMIPTTRRALLRFANSQVDYSDSEMSQPSDVTCLSFIHYLENEAKLVFRASDVANELVIDILTINEFFLKPVYRDIKYNVSVYASTAQNVSKWFQMTGLLRKLGT